MSLGVIISVMTGWLAWTMLCAEIPNAAAKNGTFPKFFAAINNKGAATRSLLVSSIIMQLVMVLLYFSSNAWNTMINITSVMVIPAYLTTTLFLAISVIKGNNEWLKRHKIIAFLSGFTGAIFCLFMLYVSDIKYIMMIPFCLTAGIPLYIWAKIEQRKEIFTFNEYIYLGGLLLLDLILIIWLVFIK